MVSTLHKGNGMARFEVTVDKILTTVVEVEALDSTEAKKMALEEVAATSDWTEVEVEVQSVSSVKE
jgi:hypothetical protein